MPQIEVSFDIDANGIVNVAAKDLGTQREQSIRITASSGLSEEEIQNLIKDAEMHAEEDHKRRELIDARNQADAMVYSTEKSLKEYGDKVDASVKSAIEAAVGKTKDAIEGGDVAVIKAAMEDLQQASHKLAEAMYQQAGPQGPEQGHGGPGGPGGPGAAQSGRPKEDVVDAEFEEVKK